MSLLLVLLLQILLALLLLLLLLLGALKDLRGCVREVPSNAAYPLRLVPSGWAEGGDA